MKFRTEIQIPSLTPPLDYKETFLLLGSCFSEAIGQRMQRLLFDCRVNPFGILFNPQSVLQALERMAAGRLFEAGELQVNEEEGYCFSWQHHGRFAAPTPDEALRMINEEYRLGVRAFRKCRTLLLTWGTSFVYIHKSRGEVVANCHKFPAALFLRRRLTVREIVESYAAFLESWFAADESGERRVVLTVSPVRHLRDGLHENQLSKSILLLAVEELQHVFPGRVLYFPAYELLLDDLRDYRFYASDLLHPSEQAEEYVFERFCEAGFSAETRKAMQDVAEWVRMKEHKPLHPFAKSLAAFEQKVQEKKKKLLVQYPFLSERL